MNFQKIELVIYNKHDLDAKFKRLKAAIQEREDLIKTLSDALRPFAQLTALDEEDLLKEESVLEIHRSPDVFSYLEAQFYRYQQPFQPLTFGHIKNARRALSLIEL